MTGLVMQALFDWNLKLLRREVGGRVLTRCIRMADRAARRWRPNSTVGWTYCGVTLRIPYGHILPRILFAYPGYSSNLARIAAACASKYEDATMIDIGANIGDSTALVRGATSMPVLCVEGDQAYLDLLVPSVQDLNGVEVEPSFLGAEDTTIRGAVVSNEGNTYIDVSGRRASSAIEVRRLDSVLARHPAFAHPRLIKVDADGFDGIILRSAKALLAAEQPIVFFEFDPFFLTQQGDDGVSIFAMLTEAGYEELLVWDNFGDFMMSMRTTQTAMLQEVHQYFSGRNGLRYADIAVFAHKDLDVMRAIIVKETEVAAERQRLSRS